jgi:hypothetical protein
LFFKAREFGIFPRWHELTQEEEEEIEEKKKQVQNAKLVALKNVKEDEKSRMKSRREAYDVKVR